MLPDTSSTTLLVCTRCRRPEANPAAPRPGAALFDAVLRIAPEGPGVRAAGVACLSGCKRPCAAALLAPGKVSYLFGDLTPDTEGAADLLAAARAHAARPDGYLARASRPERLRTGILARLPPLQWAAEGGTVAWPA